MGLTIIASLMEAQSPASYLGSTGFMLVCRAKGGRECSLLESISIRSSFHCTLFDRELTLPGTDRNESPGVLLLLI